jgi:hypothetical protein
MEKNKEEVGISILELLLKEKFDLISKTNYEVTHIRESIVILKESLIKKKEYSKDK